MVPGKFIVFKMDVFMAPRKTEFTFGLFWIKSNFNCCQLWEII